MAGEVPDVSTASVGDSSAAAGTVTPTAMSEIPGRRAACLRGSLVGTMGRHRNYDWRYDWRYDWSYYGSY